MCNEVSITCGNSGLKNAHLQLVHGSTLRLFFLLVPGGSSVTACELLSIMRIDRHRQLLPRRVPRIRFKISPNGRESKNRQLEENCLSYARSSALGLAPHCQSQLKWAPKPDAGKHRPRTTHRFYFAESAVPLVYVLANVANARPIGGIERQYLKDHELLKQISKILHTHPNIAMALHNPKGFGLGLKSPSARLNTASLFYSSLLLKLPCSYSD
jgi:hypothetical protein